MKTSPDWLEKIIQSQRQDGVILVGQSDQDAIIRKAAATYKALVAWGSYTPGQSYCSVGTDNIMGGRRATEHLLSLGRRRIAFLGMPSLPEIGMRQQGYFEALTALGLVVDPKLCVETQFSFNSAYEAAIGLVKSGASFDGIFAASDVIALATIQALKSCEIAVPQDVSVVGFDDIAIASQSTPPLTTIHQDLAKGASTIVDLLFKKIAGDEVDAVTLEPELIIRASCGADVVKS
jgi:DNA-binding LacI/PurR family transcriptional regulator